MINKYRSPALADLFDSNLNVFVHTPRAAGKASATKQYAQEWQTVTGKAVLLLTPDGLFELDERGDWVKVEQ